MLKTSCIILHIFHSCLHVAKDWLKAILAPTLAATQSIYTLTKIPGLFHSNIFGLTRAVHAILVVVET